MVEGPTAGNGSCIFCAIAAGGAPAERIDGNDRAIAFLTIGPLRPGHVLVVPRAHAVTLDEVAPDDWLAVTRLGLDVARRQRERLGAEGVTLFLASGGAGEQSVGHLHLHVVPRSASDGLDLTSWWESRVHRPSEGELRAIGRRLRGGAG